MVRYLVLRGSGSSKGKSLYVGRNSKKGTLEVWEELGRKVVTVVCAGGRLRRDLQDMVRIWVLF